MGRPTDWLFLLVIRPAWAYRIELGLIWLLGVVYYWISWHLGGRWAEALILATAIVVAAVPWTRERLARLLYRSHLRRRWALACRHAELATRNDRVPRITRCQLTKAGGLLRVRVPAGAQVPDLEAASERVAAFLAAREVRVTREPESARYARVVVVRFDPLADPKPIPWPLVDARSCSLWRPLPVGVDEDGAEVTITLPERNLLLGGEPGGGEVHHPATARRGGGAGPGGAADAVGSEAGRAGGLAGLRHSPGRPQRR
jgi:hypothetical protein